MAYSRSIDEPASPTEPACMHLRSKGMYMTGKLTPNHDQDGVGDGYCWCNMTQNQLGPDRQGVGRVSCVQGRDCFQIVL